ncbi:hypothetical protein LCGC14_1928830 [marine sediment metagenome]|uniref:Uncharacterized protein n=1 Tax=marine sediment metagenome TaxID=412755 RepID=A0A0F9ILE8_9ZZZZ
MTEKDWWIWNYTGEKESLNELGLNLTREQIENFLSAFMEIFDNYWYDSFPEDKKEGILNRHFRFNYSPFSLTWMIRLGECILNLRNIKGFDNETETRLRDKNQFQSISIELDYSSCFTQAGIDLELQTSMNSLKNDGKVIINEKSIIYEIINQNPVEFQRKGREYSIEIFKFLKNKFGSKETFIKFKKRNMDTEFKINKLYNILESVNLPFNYEDDELKIHIADENGGSSIEGYIMDRKKSLEIWVKRIHKKYKQLPPDEGGIIIANSSNIWDSQDIDVVLNTSWRETKERQKSRIGGIIFCVRQMLGVPCISGERISFVSPIIISNKYSRFDYTDELREMARALCRFPNWM